MRRGVHSLHPFALASAAGLGLMGIVPVSAAGAPSSGSSPRVWSGPHSIEFCVVPAATGRQLVRTSLPFPDEFLPDGLAVRVHRGQEEIPASLRVLTRHPSRKSVRRALVTFVYDFPSREPVRFQVGPTAARSATWPAFPVEVRREEPGLVLQFTAGPAFDARLIAPPLKSNSPPRIEVVETNAHFRWWRWHYADPEWPRVIEVRQDVLGALTLVAHVERRGVEDGFAPEIGWEIQGPGVSGSLEGTAGRIPWSRQTAAHSFSNGAVCSFSCDGGRLRIFHPAGPHKRRGDLEVRRKDGGGFTYIYRRCRAEERVPMQPYSWQRAELCLAPTALPPLTPTLESPHRVEVEPELWRELYGVQKLEAHPEIATRLLGDDPALAAYSPPKPSDFSALLHYHREAIVRSMALGDDWGNLTAFTGDAPQGGVFGMNRLNHCAPIFAEAWRSGDRRLREVALLWCDNFFDLSIWWGPNQTGGTRYNNIVAMNRTPLTREFMWRSNGSVNFCTKGYDAFFLAYEETGDPRFLEALRAQMEYAREHVHVDGGECRNIGDARDFVRLYEFTGEPRYLEEALRLFRELRTKLSAGALFDQGGKPIVADPPFIETDDVGLRQGYAKPYIIGYALAGLPELARYRPHEPRLRETIQAVADFLAQSIDPVGGWRYPHPRSSGVLLSQALEHAWQLAQAGQCLGMHPKHLDAIERVLRARLHGWLASGKILSGLGGWEVATGKVKEAKELNSLYAKPADRDSTRDYTEGQISLGSAPPEGLVYLSEVLGYYLKHRPLERLLAPPKPDEPLGQVLKRVK